MTPQFPRLFLWHVARGASRAARCSALNIFSVALGVAVYLAIQIANHSANQSFAASIDLVAGKANLEVRSPGGAFDESVFPRLASAAGVRAATPLVDGYLTLPDYPGEYLQILGVDLLTNLPFSTFTIGDQRDAGIDLGTWLAGPDIVAVSEEFAHTYHLKAGDKLRAQVNGKTVTLTIYALISLKDSPAGANSRIGAMDIGWAQELFQKRGTLSSIQLMLDDPAQADAVSARLRKEVPADVTIAPPGQRSRQVERMVAGFQLNLSALSLVSLLVGMFLIYNTISASVVRRPREVGILRAVGATRLEIHCLFLGEALLFGVVGVGLGLAGGLALATVLVSRVAETISSLYLLVHLNRFYVSPLLVSLAIFFGLGSVLAAAWFPAREGARLNPVKALNLGSTMERAVRLTPRWLWLGLLALAAAVATSQLALTTGPKWLGFVSAFFVLLGFALVTPSSTVAAAAASRPAHRRRRAFAPGGEPRTSRLPILRLAAQNLSRSIHRNAVTVAALMAAIAMTVGISVMVYAFRRTVEVWIDHAIVADLFITPAANETLGNGAFLPREVVTAFRANPAVDAIDTFREVGVTIQGERISLAAVEGHNRNRLPFVGGHDLEKQAHFFQPGTVLVTESFSHHFGLGDGDHLPIPTPAGVVDFVIGGVYYDYTRDQGVILMNRENFDRYWHDDRIQSAALYLKEPAKVERRGRPAPEVQRRRRAAHLLERLHPEAHLRDLRADVLGDVRAARHRGDRRDGRHFPGAHDTGDRARAGHRRAARHRGVARANPGGDPGRVRIDRLAGERPGHRRRAGALAGADVCRQQSILWLDDPDELPVGIDPGDSAVDRRLRLARGMAAGGAGRAGADRGRRAHRVARYLRKRITKGYR